MIAPNKQDLSSEQVVTVCIIARLSEDCLPRVLRFSYGAGVQLADTRDWRKLANVLCCC